MRTETAQQRLQREKKEEAFLRYVEAKTGEKAIKEKIALVLWAYRVGRMSVNSI